MSNVSRAGGEDPNNATSQVRFGRSVESKAQIDDAAAAGADFGGETLNLYRLEPIAAFQEQPGTRMTAEVVDGSAPLHTQRGYYGYPAFPRV